MKSNNRLVGFLLRGITTFMGYLMPNFLYTHMHASYVHTIYKQTVGK